MSTNLKLPHKLEDVIIGDDIGLVYVDPFIGLGKITPPLTPENIARRLRSESDKRNSLLVFDERVFDGIGRMGQQWPHQPFDFQPDARLFTFNSSLTTILANEKAAALLGSGKKNFKHLGTSDALLHLNKYNYSGCLSPLVDYFQQQLLKYLGNLPQVKQLGGAGLMGIVEVDEGYEIEELKQRCRKRSMNIEVVSNLIVLYPSLEINEEEFQKGIKILADYIRVLKPSYNY